MESHAASLDVESLTQFCRALGDETRLRIVALLTHGELCSCHIESALSLSQPNASRHLSILKTAGIVRGRKQGTWVYYRLASPADAPRRKLLATLAKTFGAEAALRADIERVIAEKGAGPCR